MSFLDETGLERLWQQIVARISSPRESVSLIDIETGDTYVLQIKNGNLITQKSTS